MYKRILVPLDGSEQAEAVLPYVRTLAENSHAEIILLRVFVPRAPHPLFIRPQWRVTEAPVDLLRLFMEGYLNRIAEQLQLSRVRVTTAACDESAADAILRCAENFHADVIAMSAYDKGGNSPWHIESTTQHVTRRSAVPVLLVGGKSEPRNRFSDGASTPTI